MMSSRNIYRLADHVRVRKEPFGLLFYNPNGPRLTLVHSGAWLEKSFFFDGIALDKWLRRRFESIAEAEIGRVENQLSEVLSELTKKGLLIDVLADS